MSGERLQDHLVLWFYNIPIICQFFSLVLSYIATNTGRSAIEIE